MNIIINNIEEEKIKYYKKDNYYKIFYNDILNITGLPTKIKYDYIYKYNNLYYVYLDKSDIINNNLIKINNYFKNKIDNFLLYRKNLTNTYIICNNYKNLIIDNISNNKELFITVNKIKYFKKYNIPIINIL
tara:strand:+ start:7422 stop:7817 length:396 start_codon:yes stop_codon:yes gene_type:complete